MITSEQRIDNLEEALMLFMAILSGEPEDATEDERKSSQLRCASLMEEIRDRFVAKSKPSILKGDGR